MGAVVLLHYTQLTKEIPYRTGGDVTTLDRGAMMRRFAIGTLLCAAVFCLQPARADAGIEHSVFTGFEDPNNIPPIDVSDGDSVTGATSADITTDILAGINLQFTYEATASVGRFGNLGVSAFQATDGELHTQVVIRSDEFVNLGLPRRATANFIIDGGEIELVANTGAIVEFQLTITSNVSNGGDFRRWQHFADIEANNFSSVTYTSNSSTDIGAFVDPSRPTRVEIPFSFQSFDLGIIPSGATIDLEYQLDIFSNIPIAPEIVRWNFSDPLSVDGFSNEFPTVEFESTPGVVPEPSSLTLAALGVLGISGLLWRRRKPASHD